MREFNLSREETYEFMIRRLFNIGSALSLLLWVAVGICWLRSPEDLFVSHDRRVFFWTDQNDLELDLTGVPPAVGQSFGPSVQHGVRYAGFDDLVGISPHPNYRRVIHVHLAIVLGATALLPMLWLAIWRIRRRDQIRRIDQGLCLACGYDLKENTSGVCPECGTATNPNGRSIA